MVPNERAISLRDSLSLLLVHLAPSAEGSPKDEPAPRGRQWRVGLLARDHQAAAGHVDSRFDLSLARGEHRPHRADHGRCAVHRVHTLPRPDDDDGGGRCLAARRGCHSCRLACVCRSRFRLCDQAVLSERPSDAFSLRSAGSLSRVVLREASLVFACEPCR